MVELTTNITTGRVTVSNRTSAVVGNLSRGYISVSANSPSSSGGGHGDSLLLENGSYFLLESGDALNLG